MVKPKKKESDELKRVKDRERKRLKHLELKKDPEKYRIFQEKEKQKYLLKKAKKQIVSINEMSHRGQRLQRKKWREYSRAYKKKKKEQKRIQNVSVNSPLHNTEEEDDILNETIEDPLASPERLATPSTSRPDPKDSDIITHSCNTQKSPKQTSRMIRQLRYRTQKVISNLKNSVAQLTQENKTLRKKCEVIEDKYNAAIQDSLEKDVNHIIAEIRADKVEDVKKQLIFNESIKRGLQTVYTGLKKTEKRPFIEKIKPNMKKHAVSSKLPFRLRQKVSDQMQKGKQSQIQVKTFFEEDCHSQIAAGKREYVKKRGIRKQKRYLTDNLKNLHEKFCRTYGYISYSHFCMNRPFWVVFPNLNQRDTCMCKTHGNVELLITALKKADIIAEATTTDVLKSLCCDIYNDKCLSRSCDSCKNKVLNYKEFDNSKRINYCEWSSYKKSYVGRDGKTKQIFAKDKLKKQDLPRNVITKLEIMLKPFFRHVLNIHVQYLSVKEKKQNLNDDEIIIHVDFSENFNYKYNAEIQDFHFGGSRGQVSLHTGVMYYKDSSGSFITKSFCTMSDSLEHNASSIWAHLVPILEIAKQRVPSVSKIHFVSDSPSSQYRNRYMFYMITQIKKQIPYLALCTWNYQEAGHGKGAPDGIGALVKRTADNHVKFGGDVGCFEDFVGIVQKNIKNVDLIVVDGADIKSKKFPDNIPSFKGTLKVHQTIWSSFLPYSVAFRSLSCFACDNSFIPCEHGKHLGMLSMLNKETIAATEEQIVEDYLSTKSPEYKALGNLNSENINFDIGSVHIDTPTLMNEIQDSFLKEFGDNCDESEIRKRCEIDGTLITKMDARRKNEPMKENNMILSEVDGSLIPKHEAHKTGTDMDQNSNSINSSKSPKVKILSQIILKPSSRHNIKTLITRNKTQNSECVGQISNNMMEVELDMNNRCEDVLLPDLQFVHDIDHRRTSYTSNAENFEKDELMDVESDEGGLPKYDIYKYRYNIDTWVVVEYKIKNKTHIYIGKIINYNHETNEYKVLFVKKVQSRAIKFSWPAISDEDTIPASYIKQILEDPIENRRGEFVFNNLPKLNFK